MARPNCKLADTELCPGLVDYVMIRIKELFIKNEKATIMF